MTLVRGYFYFFCIFFHELGTRIINSVSLKLLCMNITGMLHIGLNWIGLDRKQNNIRIKDVSLHKIKVL